MLKSSSQKPHMTIGASAFVYVLTVVSAGMGLIVKSLAFTDAAIIGLVLFILLEIKNTTRTHALVSFALAATGISFAYIENSLQENLYIALSKTLPYLLLFASIGWLQSISAESPALLAVRKFVLQQTSGKRYTSLLSASHFLSVTFNLAGLSLLAPFLSTSPQASLTKRLSRAITQGFGAATTWSPFFVGTAVIIASVEGISWIDVGPIGLFIALLLLAWNSFVDRTIGKRCALPASCNPQPGRMPIPHRSFIKTTGIIISLFLCIITLVEYWSFSIPVALALTAPTYTVIWSIFLKRAGIGDGLKERCIDVIHNYRNLRSEALIFTGANIFGVGLTTVLPTKSIQSLLSNVSMNSSVSLIALLFIGVSISAIGLHPLVYVIIVTSVLTPEMLDIPPVLFALCLTHVWGQGTIISPLSAVSLYISRMTNQSIYEVSWKWNAGYVTLSSMFIASALAVINIVIYQ